MTGHTVTHYRVGEKLGEGGTAAVYRAEDLALGREVVIKFFSSAGAGSVARLQHEARTVSSLNHPNICTIYEIGEHDGHPFMVMEMLDGQVLSQVMGGRPLATDRLLDLGAQMADALEAAHAEGIVHRDVKPANIFLTRAGRIKLLDFGVAVLLPRRVDAATARSLFSSAGTFSYMSPEQARVEELDHRSDLFSLGIVLYEMAVGRRPFAGTTTTAVLSAIADEPLVAPRALNPEVPAELERIITKALEKRTALRYQTASDLKVDLQRLSRDLDRAASGPAPVPSRTSMPPKRSPLALRTAAAVGVTVLVGAGWLAVALSRARPTDTASPAPVNGRVRGSDIELPAVPAVIVAVRERPSTASEAPTPRASATGEPPRVSAPAPSPASAAAPSPASAAAPSDDLLVAKRQIDLQLYDQALDNLRRIAQGSDSRSAIDASFLMASVHGRRNDTADAMGTYVEIAHRFPADSRAAEALILLAETTLKSKQRDKETDAGRVLTELASTYPDSPWAPRALLMRGDIEARQGTHQRDAVLGGSVPTAAVTYRELADRYASSDSAAAALRKLARIYSDTKRFDVAAATYERLATRGPDDGDEAWFAAGELYEKRLKDSVRARAAYARVRPESPRYAEARKRLTK